MNGEYSGRVSCIVRTSKAGVKDMADEGQLKILKEGVAVWNEWRKQGRTFIPDLFEPNLRGANLCGADLREARLDGADLGRADLSKTDLTGADLRGANLSGADLSTANLEWANLRRAKLVGVDLHDANLRGANLTRASLSAADLGGSILFATLLGDVDLSSVKGLETVRHEGPSTIGIDTIYRSKGNIPEVLLQGAGVPHGFIPYVKSLVSSVTAIEYYSCFISFSTKDVEFAKRLYADLQGEHVRCWFALHDVKGGRKLHEQIDQAIRVYERVLLILSLHSMNSEWVKTEIAKARKREAEQKKQVLFPLRLVSFETIRDWECFDADTGKDSAREIREYFIPDFSDWKNQDEYQKAFGLLMRDLKAGDKGSD